MTKPKNICCNEATEFHVIGDASILHRERINAEVRWGGNSVVLKIWTRSRPPALYSPHKVLIFRILLEHYSVVQQEICDLRPFTVYTALIWNCQICARWLQ